MTTLHDRPWSDADYPFLDGGTGAAKLADSAIAPLVARARGYRTVRSGDVKSVLGQLGHSDKLTTKPAKALRAATVTDGLLMPWYVPAQVKQAQTTDIAPAFAQVRPDPATLRPDANGKTMKYVNIPGSDIGLGVHPATPVDWIERSSILKSTPIIFTEGLLKADSVLTAQLLAGGVAAEALSVDPDDDPMTARVRLSNIMAKLPEEYRYLVIGLVSVTTWSGRAEWNALSARDGVPWYCSFDGDVAANPKVWTQADKLMSEFAKHHAAPRWLDLSRIDSQGKVGVDDYLATVGTFDDLIALAVADLPDKPDDDTDAGEPGEWRMNPATLVTEKFIPGDENRGGYWKQIYPFAARVKVVETVRSASELELSTGQIDQDKDDEDDDEVRVRLEVSWYDPKTGERHDETVTGGQYLLTDPASRWSSKPHPPKVPVAVTRLADWPPNEQEFLKAAKNFRIDETIERPLWKHMGWVPNADASKPPVFVVGRQVIGANGLEPAAAATAVVKSEVRAADEFGVILPKDDQAARKALREVMDLYYPVDPDKCPWRKPQNATLCLAAALRPTLPRRPKCSVVLAGASNSGKSWTMASMMAFWQPRPGTWATDRLPGSAEDTAASLEVSLSKLPILPVDDLNPGEGDQNNAIRKNEAVWKLVRSAHNGASRQRRNSTMTAQQKFDPRALLVISAEMGPTEESTLNRTVLITTQKNQFLSESRDNTDLLAHRAATHAPQAILTGYIIRMLAQRASRDGWEKLIVDIEDQASLVKTQLALRSRSGDSTRQQEVFADLHLGLWVLELAAEELGVAGEFSDRFEDMADDIERALQNSYHRGRSETTSHRAIEAMRSLLSSGRCHVRTLGSGQPPMDTGSVGFQNADQVNSLLGWQPTEDGWRPQGTTVGDVIVDAAGKPVVVFDTKAATVVMHQAKTLTTMQEQPIWESVRTDYGHPQWKPKTDGWRQRVTRNGYNLEGIVVPLDALIPAAVTDDAPAGSDAA